LVTNNQTALLSSLDCHTLGVPEWGDREKMDLMKPVRACHEGQEKGLWSLTTAGSAEASESGSLLLVSESEACLACQLEGLKRVRKAPEGGMVGMSEEQLGGCRNRGVFK